MKDSYGNGGGGKSGGAHGPGGLKAAASRQPNEHPGPNDAPDGPFSHCLGYSGDAGMQGDTSCKHRGGTFHFK